MAQPFELLGIDHVVLRSARVDAMLAFYQTVLGATLERELEAKGLYQLRAGRSLIDIVDINKPLGQAGGDAPNGDAPNMDHFCLRIEPWHEQQLLDHLQAHGIAVSPIATRYGADGFGSSVYITDPEGNTVELKGGPTPD